MQLSLDPSVVGGSQRIEKVEGVDAGRGKRWSTNYQLLQTTLGFSIAKLRKNKQNVMLKTALFV
jgi:hypothetical protein